MSLSQLRTNLFVTFALMRDSDATIEVYHRRKVYKLHIEHTNQKVTKRYKPRKDKKIVPNSLIESVECPECGSLIVNGLCMNRDCITNQKPAEAGS